jgi:hypothetical protein
MLFVNNEDLTPLDINKDTCNYLHWQNQEMTQAKIRQPHALKIDCR